jgi:hypothetical protein
MAKETVAVRVESDTREQVEQYAEKHDVSESEAYRRMIRGGLRVSQMPLFRHLI